MWPITLIILYCALIAVASMLGGWLPARVRLSHTATQLMMSFVGGLMLGVAVLHLLPHAAVELDKAVENSLDVAAGWMLAGLIGMFLMMRLFHFHQHDPHGDEIAHGTQVSSAKSDCDESHEHLMSHLAHSDQPHRLSWIGLFFGLAIHTLIDGIALAASVKVELAHGQLGSLMGLSTFLAVLLHKPLDAFSITTVMVAAGWKRSWIHSVNLLFALMCPVGALCFFFGVSELGTTQSLVVGAALGFSAGVFLCISLADILPEVQFHRHDPWKLTGALLVGVVVACLIGVLEHGDAHRRPGDQHQDHHEQHDDHVH